MKRKIVLMVTKYTFSSCMEYNSIYWKRLNVIYLQTHTKEIVFICQCEVTGCVGQVAVDQILKYISHESGCILPQESFKTEKNNRIYTDKTQNIKYCCLSNLSAAERVLVQIVLILSGVLSEYHESVMFFK